MTQGLVIVMALTCSLTQIFTFEKQTKDFEQETCFCMKSMVFCYLYELFWEMHLLFCKFQFWPEKCNNATEKNCKIRKNRWDTFTDVLFPGGWLNPSKLTPLIVKLHSQSKLCLSMILMHHTSLIFQLLLCLLCSFSLDCHAKGCPAGALQLAYTY